VEIIFIVDETLYSDVELAYSDDPHQYRDVSEMQNWTQEQWNEHFAQSPV
jgi:hypothetical protein